MWILIALMIIIGGGSLLLALGKIHPTTKRW